MFTNTCSGTQTATTTTATLTVQENITVATASPTGLQVKVDGVAHTAPYTFTDTVGATHTIAVDSPQSGGATITITHSYTINPEDARVNTAGQQLFFGIPQTATLGTITLTATIYDITAVPSDPSYDPYPGDIRNATVKFVNRGAGNGTLCTAPVGLVNISNKQLGAATCSFTGNVDNSGSMAYTVGVVVSGYYTRDSSDDNMVVTISQTGAGMIRGGGFLVLTSNSTGQLNPTAGKKNNFGFNVKYNKQGTNLQGNINTIVRSAVGLDGATPCSTVHPGFTTCVYQVKGNSMSSLTVTPTNTGEAATYYGKASVQDVTDPNAAPISLGGGGNTPNLKVTLHDNGTPGTNDTIGITVLNPNGGIWFSSNWNSTTGVTIEQNLAGGDLVAH